MDIEYLLEIEPMEDCYKDPDFFNPNYLPAKIEHRDYEIETLISYIRPILYNKKPRNTLILGNSGVGKTTVMKTLFNSIEKKHNNIICSYVNCQYNSSIRDVYLKIYEKVCDKKLTNQSKSTKEIFDLIFDYLSEKKTNLIVCLDDFDDYFMKKDINKMFYQLLRPYEHDKEYESIVGLFPIISNNDFRLRLSQKVLSVFQHSEINFKNYTSDQIFSILKERCDKGFCKKVITEEQIRVISNYCSVFSNMRGGLEILTNLGNMVNVSNDCKIRDDYIDIAINEHRLHNVSIN